MAGAATARADEAPGWVRDAMGFAIPESTADAPAVILELEGRVELEPTGKVIERQRSVVRITTREGAEAAQAEVPYCTDGGKVRDLRGWLIDPGGRVKTLTRSYEIDQTMLDSGLYDEYRIRRLVALKEAQPGSVFAAEWTCEQTKPFLQFEWEFQEERPVLRSRFVLALPAGWTRAAGSPPARIPPVRPPSRLRTRARRAR